MNRPDRNDMAELHSASNGLPASLRNAMGPDKKPWTQPPTPIATPSNPSRPPPRNPPARGSNPFSGRMTNNLHPNNNRFGNVTQARVILPPADSPRPAKKLKLDTNGGEAEGSKSRFFQNQAHRGQRNHDNSRRAQKAKASGDAFNDVFVVSDDEKEDVGVPVKQTRPRSGSNSSSDPINFLDSDREGATRQPNRIAEDGQSTKRLQDSVRAKQQRQESIDVDKIEEIQDSDPPRSGKVKQMVSKFERSTIVNSERKPLPMAPIKSPPNFASSINYSQGLNIKERMQAKKPPHRDLLSITSLQGPKSKAPTRLRIQASSPKVVALPLEAWTRGYEMHYCDPQDWWLILKEKKKWVIQNGSPDRPCPEVFSLSILTEVKSAKYCRIVTNMKPPVIIQLSTKRFRDSANNIPGQFVTGSNKMDGAVALKFRTNHANWSSGDAYSQFVAHLRSNLEHESCEVLDQHAAKTLWESIERESREHAKLPRDSLPPSSEGVCSEKAPSERASTSTSGKRMSMRGKKRSLSNEPESPSVATTRVTRSRKRDIDELEGGPSEPDLDKLILVYPFTGTGAVHLSNGDLRRLGPGEYLNDTLIEFGLKLWLHELRDKQPELADQVHVFSSFFYKKLNVRNKEQGYQSVRKWTAKIDLFKKKYIIVPINEHLHWYLAVICFPEHTLLPPPPQESVSVTKVKPMTRKRKREEDNTILEAIEASAGNTAPTEGSTRRSSETASSGPSTSTPPPTSRLSAPGAEVIPDSQEQVSVQQTQKAHDGEDMEVEAMLQRSCTIGDDASSPVRPPPPPNDAQSVQDVPGVHLGDLELLYPSSSPPPVPMEVDSNGDKERCNTAEQDSASVIELPAESISTSARMLSPEVELSGPSTMSESISAVAAPRDVSPEVELSGPSTKECPPTAEDVPKAVPVTTFYGGVSNKGKEKAIDVPADDADEPANEEATDSPSGEPEPNRTYIFTFDSLGTEHRAAIKLLSMYLQFEAKDKKGLENTSEAKGKSALVPFQPNFCDCGLYVLHFAKTFLSNPTRYTRLILSKTKKTYPKSERDRDWKDEEVGTMRGDLSSRVKALSLQWEAFKAEQEQQKQQGDAERQAASTSEGASGSGSATATATAAGTAAVVVDESDDEITFVDVPATTSASANKKGKGRGGKGKEKEKATVGPANRLR
ncbi:hypothetical protein K474DRAFT_1768509 [Panus rudis PR-1116 ss-1]|nr:hypothetical protein K474DRAFT_1768509 [Panus rudis PR-1116 ss-1]